MLIYIYICMNEYEYKRLCVGTYKMADGEKGVHMPHTNINKYVNVVILYGTVVQIYWQK